METLKNNFISLVALVAGIAIPTSTTLLNITLVLIPLSVLFSGHLKAALWDGLKIWFIKIAFMLYGLFVLRSLFTEVPIADVLHMLIKMLTLLGLLFSYAFFTRPRNRKFALYGYFAAVSLTLILSYISWFFNYPILHGRVWGGAQSSAWGANTWAPFEAHAYHCYFLGLASAISLDAILRHKLSKRIVYVAGLFITLASFNIFYMIASRTGQIAYLMMLIITLCVWRPKKGFVIALALLVIGIPLLVTTSPAIKSKLYQANSDLTNYKTGHDTNTSIGLRMTFHKYAKALIAHRPILGYGTGSYKTEYARIAADDKINTNSNPHNDYLWFGVELGMLGMMGLIVWILSLIFISLRLNGSYKNVGLILALTYAAICVQNSFFTDSITGIAFMLISGFVVSSLKLDRG